MISVVSLALNETLKLNDNGLLNKVGMNSVYEYDDSFDGMEEIATMRLGGIKDGVLEMLDFVSVKEGEGNGKKVIDFLFKKLPNMQSIRLKCKDGVLGFWKKVGGELVDKKDGYNIVEIRRK